LRLLAKKVQHFLLFTRKKRLEKDTQNIYFAICLQTMCGTTMNDAIGYATQQNNVGVHCYSTAGNPAAALHHFRQSLRAKLVVENRMQQDVSTAFGLLHDTADTTKTNEADPQHLQTPSSSSSSQHNDVSNRCDWNLTTTPLNTSTGTISFL
jgi:hypothetical protein